jgi:hypothetical protein
MIPGILGADTMGFPGVDTTVFPGDRYNKFLRGEAGRRLEKIHR